MNTKTLSEKIKTAQERQYQEMLKQSRISQINRTIGEYKCKLKSTDYKTLKYAEGELSAEEYAETLAQRRAWRAEINALEEEIKAITEGANEN